MSRRPTSPAGHPSDHRRQTSHERQAGQSWDASYHDGPAPWDIGEPQPAVARLVTDGGFTGAVLDAGCGTGENTLRVASLGLPVLGVDVAETALAIARKKAAARAIDAEFALADAFRLDRLGRTFETVLDCGLFHTFDAEERRDYVTSLASVTRPGATLHILCFSDVGPETGPHPVSEEELKAAFDSVWNITSISPETLMARFTTDGAPAWRATIKRL
ncbi:class I SAM-dependent methyltransferase [Amycolatopsis pigmentata]|uniref:Class I SAM-dependent methyltransferase n=1 Tax=Amycolatopsis pigmentata TaxID=450801 RepID=A0ABW5FYH8_9PSEU